MGLFGKLFEKKECSICGGEIGLLGNRKLEDGNCCKNCAKKLSPWFEERRHSTVVQIREQLAYREKNARDLDEAGGAVVILERDCSPEGRYRQIRDLLADDSRREQMTAALHRLVKADSADRICDLVEELAKS